MKKRDIAIAAGILVLLYLLAKTASEDESTESTTGTTSRSDPSRTSTSEKKGTSTSGTKPVVTPIGTLSAGPAQPGRTAPPLKKDPKPPIDPVASGPVTYTNPNYSLPTSIPISLASSVPSVPEIHFDSPPSGHIDLGTPYVYNAADSSRDANPDSNDHPDTSVTSPDEPASDKARDANPDSNDEATSSDNGTGSPQPSQSNDWPDSSVNSTPTQSDGPSSNNDVQSSPESDSWNDDQDSGSWGGYDMRSD